MTDLQPGQVAVVKLPRLVEDTPRLWSVKTPTLYTLTTTVAADNTVGVSQTYANASCCTPRPRTTPPPEENSILGVIYSAFPLTRSTTTLVSLA